MSILPKISSSGPIHLHHLFIQPSYMCGLHCKGCYVMDHKNADDPFVNMLPEADWWRFLTQFGKEITADQLSVSMDYLGKEQVKNRFMISWFDHLQDARLAWGCREGKEPEVHFTAYNVYTFQRYIAFSRIQAPDLLSISNLTVDDIPWLTEAGQAMELNYNHTVPWGVTSQNIDKYVEKLNLIGQAVDSIHLVINKPMMDKKPPSLVQLGKVSRMRTDVAYIGTLMKRLDPDVRKKLHVDRCLQDVYKNAQSGFGCSANISKFTVWPDGSVSGCPYAGSGTTDRAYRAQDIMDNIRKAAQQYEFRDRCHLPAIYDRLSG